MITEDQLEHLAIQWFQDTGGENIEHRTLNIERRREEKGVFVDSVRIPGSRQISRQSVARGVVDDRGMNRDIVSRFGGDLGERWGIATGIPTICGARKRPPTIKSDLIVRTGGGGRATGKSCLQVQGKVGLP